MSDTQFDLSDREIRRYFERGFAGPFTIRTPSEMVEVREHVDSLLETDGPWGNDELSEMLIEGHSDGARIVDRHVDCRTVADLCLDPALTERLASLYGENLLLLFTQFLQKEANSGKIVGWHQDAGFYGLHPSVCPTAWIAIDEVTAENGALEFLPGSHGEPLQHAETSRDDHWFDYELDPERGSRIDETEAVTVELQPGEFVLFSNTVLHRSSANASDRRRLGLQVRSTVPYATITKPKRPAPSVVVQHGDDYCDVHDASPPPETCHH